MLAAPEWRRFMSLTERATHFEFGENWRDFSKSIDQERIDAAMDGLRKLFPEGLVGKTFLDIGCGSGLNALAALSLGAASVTAVDIDENSVSTTQTLLTARAPDSSWSAKVVSVFDVTPDTLGTFDVVYSWGVLHHTGNMWKAIDLAARLVSPGGLYAIAIYTKTSLCGFWQYEKAFYSKSPKPVQTILRYGYMAASLGSMLVTMRNPVAFVQNYKSSRGMRWSNDIHDWLGGYPYESASAQEMQSFLNKIGLVEVRSFPTESSLGFSSAGCGEYVYSRLLPQAGE
jgi:SAM-dependent methyltransferase